MKSLIFFSVQNVEDLNQNSYKNCKKSYFLSFHPIFSRFNAYLLHLLFFFVRNRCHQNSHGNSRMIYQFTISHQLKITFAPFWCHCKGKWLSFHDMYTTIILVWPNCILPAVTVHIYMIKLLTSGNEFTSSSNYGTISTESCKKRKRETRKQILLTL